jgi:ketosteroid isomerase-like protein
VFEPGWRWSNDIGPIAGTPSCRVRHLGYVISGRMQIRMDDGTETIIDAGDMFDLPPGHDAWVVGDEPCVMVDYSSELTGYARGRAADLAPADNEHMTMVRRGFDAFNTGDMDALRTLMAHDVVQHVPGTSQVAGVYKGIDAVLGLYAKLFELTEGTLRCDLIDVFGDNQGHVTATYLMTATRGGVTRVAREALLFTFLGDRVTDLLELHSDLPGDDAFFA